MLLQRLLLKNIQRGSTEMIIIQQMNQIILI